MEYDADVAVVGTGSMGALSAWQLARRGIRPMCFEQFAPGHDRGSAGGESRLFRTAYAEGSRYVPLLREARKQWRELEAESGVPLLTINSGLMIGSRGGDFLAGVRTSIEDHGIDHEVLDSDELQKRFPQHSIGDDEEAILDHESGYLRPELAVAIAAEEAERSGAKIHTHTPVRRLRRESDSIVVVTDEREYRFPRIIVTTGAWTNKLLPGLTPALDVQRLIMTWFPTRYPEQFRSNVFPIFVRRANGYDISGWPTLDGTSVKVCINYGWDHVADVDTVNRTVDDRLFAPISEAVTRFLPSLIPEPARVGVYFDGYTNDHHPFVGLLPADERIVVMGGFSGHGFKMASALGLAAAELINQGKTSLPIDHLTPSRFSSTPTVEDQCPDRQPRQLQPAPTSRRF